MRAPRGRRRPRRRLLSCGPALVGLALLLAAATATALSATGQAPAAVARQAQVLDVERTGVASPVGLAFSGASGSFYVIDPSASSEVVRLNPFEMRPGSDRTGATRIAAAAQAPINMAFDERGGRLLLLAGNSGPMLQVSAGAGGDLDARAVVRHAVRSLDLQDPQGMTVNPETGTVFILDARGPRVVRVDPGVGGGLADASVSSVNLQTGGAGDFRGIAFDPSTGHLHVRGGEALYELEPTGAVVAVRDLSDVGLVNPQGMTVAPTGDLTDDSQATSLYVADSGSAVAGSGRIVEVALTSIATAQAASFTSSLIATINTGTFQAGQPNPEWNPKSPDPSGLTYLPTSNRIQMVDGEVEETVGGISHFRGANAWEITLSGTIFRTANLSKVDYPGFPSLVDLTDEPTGVAFKPSTGQYFVTDDGAKRVYTLNPGADGLIGTSDDTKSFFLTNVSPNTNTDPEGIAYDSWNDRVFVADGVNAEVYQYTTTGTLIGHFDVQTYGVGDPEAVEFNPDTGTLYVLSNRQSGRIIVETTTGGALIQTISVAASNAFKPAGLTIAPAGNGTAVKRFYIADRGIDNNDNPSIIDGKIYEMSMPSSGPPNQPPVITSSNGGDTASVSVPENTTAVTDVDATDPDNDPLTYSISGGADSSFFSIVPTTGVLTFKTGPDFENPLDTGGNNTYEVTVSVSDGRGGIDTQAITVTVTNVAETNQPPVITSDGGGPTASISIPENTTAVTDVDATDPENQTLSWGITGGADQAKFSIVATSGVLTFVTAPDFENPTDSDTNNTYVVSVTVSDGNGGSDSQTITVTVGDVNESGGAPLYFSLRDAATVGGVTTANEDILFYDGTSFSMYFDGSDVGIGGLRIDAFGRLDANTLLFSFDADKSIAAIGAVDDSDVYRFNATSLGPNTSGTFELYFDGSDVGLTAGAHDVDLFELLPNGTIVISTTGSNTLTGSTVRDEDMVVFTPTSLGDITAGSFAWYFDGSDVGLGESGEDVNALTVDASGRLYISAPGVFAVPGVSGDDEDVFVFTPTGLGSTTSGTYDPVLYFDGSVHGLAANDVYAIELP